MQDDVISETHKEYDLADTSTSLYRQEIENRACLTRYSAVNAPDLSVWGISFLG